jgi:hypothetical protein
MDVSRKNTYVRRVVFHPLPKMPASDENPICQNLSGKEKKSFIDWHQVPAHGEADADKLGRRKSFGKICHHAVVVRRVS